MPDDAADRKMVTDSQTFRALDSVPASYGLKKLVVDGIASGLPYDLLRQHSRLIWGFEITDAEIEKIKNENATDVIRRREEIASELDKRGFVNIASDMVTKLRERIDESDGRKNVKEFVMLATTLKMFLDYFISRKDEKELQQVQIQTVNVQYNDFRIIQELADENVIEIKDVERLRRMFSIPNGLDIKKLFEKVDGKTDKMSSEGAIDANEQK